MLRQFVILHLDKIIQDVKDKIITLLIDKVDKFNFSNGSDHELIELKYKLAEKEQQILEINPEKIAEDTTNEILSMDDVAAIKQQILADLKKANPELETEHWI